jgi:hypothetical protein
MRKLLMGLPGSRRLRLGMFACLAALAALTGTVLASGSLSGSDSPWPYAPGK